MELSPEERNRKHKRIFVIAMSALLVVLVCTSYFVATSADKKPAPVVAEQKVEDAKPAAPTVTTEEMLRAKAGAYVTNDIVCYDEKNDQFLTHYTPKDPKEDTPWRGWFIMKNATGLFQLLGNGTVAYVYSLEPKEVEVGGVIIKGLLCIDDPLKR